jgi:hypothetical protein
MIVNVEEIRSTFLRGGHKLVERNFGHSNEVNRQLLLLAGGNALKAQRAAVQRTGRKAGGRMVEAEGE